MDVTTLQQTVVAALEDIKARDIEVIDTSRLTPLFDRVIVASAESGRQTRALARNVITREQYSAAQKYRHHWYHAGLAGPLGSIDLDRIFAPDLGAYSGMARTESQLFHRQRYREAVQAVGKLGSHVLDWTVCRETPLEQVGYTLGWSSRPQAYAAAAERTKTALDELCRLWGIGVESRRE